MPTNPFTMNRAPEPGHPKHSGHPATQTVRARNLFQLFGLSLEEARAPEFEFIQRLDEGYLNAKRIYSTQQPSFRKPLFDAETAQKRLTELERAYAILRNPTSRKQYLKVIKDQGDATMMMEGEPVQPAVVGGRIAYVAILTIFLIWVLASGWAMVDQVAEGLFNPGPP